MPNSFAENQKGHRNSEQSAVEAMAIAAYYDQVSIANGGRVHGSHYRDWPLPNVWIGVSVEDQATANERIPLLLETPAAVRWVSAEPLLGPVDLTNVYLSMIEYYTTLVDNLDWVVVGGESGPKARPMHPDWVRSLRDQCAATGVPFLFKQWGEWIPAESDDNGDGEGRVWFPVTSEARVGKKRAGRLLDGVLHDAYPEVPR